MRRQGLGPNCLGVGIQGLGSKALDPRLWMGTQGFGIQGRGFRGLDQPWIQGLGPRALDYKAVESKVPKALNPCTTVNNII